MDSGVLNLASASVENLFHLKQTQESRWTSSGMEYDTLPQILGCRVLQPISSVDSVLESVEPTLYNCMGHHGDLWYQRLPLVNLTACRETTPDL